MTQPRNTESAPTILLVDDEPTTRRLIRRMIKGAYPTVEVREASNGDEALDLLTVGTVCVIADIHMPERDGFALCSAIRKSAALAPWRELPVILVSGLHCDESLIARAWSAGTALVLPKPFKPADLVRLISGSTSLPASPTSAVFALGSLDVAARSGVRGSTSRGILPDRYEVLGTIFTPEERAAFREVLTPDACEPEAITLAEQTRVSSSPRQ